METLLPHIWIAAFGIAILAGAIKGVVGFGMPMILISGLGSIMAPELALAGLILPTLMSNGMQSLRQGWRAAWASVKRFRVFLLVGFVFLVSSSQLVRLLSPQALFLTIGIPVSFFALVQLVGIRPKLSPAPKIEAAVGSVAGFVGGISGVWGPPTVLYLTAIETEKTEQIRVQGVIYGLGAVALTGAHVSSGVLRLETLPFSAVLMVPAFVGMWIGGRISDRIDQVTFRRATLIILTVAGLNLVRRGLMM